MILSLFIELILFDVIPRYPSTYVQFDVSSPCCAQYNALIHWIPTMKKKTETTQADRKSSPSLGMWRIFCRCVGTVGCSLDGRVIEWTDVETPMGGLTGVIGLIDRASFVCLFFFCLFFPPPVLPRWWHLRQPFVAIRRGLNSNRPLKCSNRKDPSGHWTCFHCYILIRTSDGRTRMITIILLTQVFQLHSPLCAGRNMLGLNRNRVSARPDNNINLDHLKWKFLRKWILWTWLQWP